MATSSYMTFLMYKDGEEWKNLVPIKDYPDLGGSPEMLETTTLSDYMQTYIEGIQSLDALEFNINYDLATYTTISAMKGIETPLAVWFGGEGPADNVTPTGSEGKFEFNGFVSIRVTGKGVNEVREAVVSVAPSTPIVLGE